MKKLLPFAVLSIILMGCSANQIQSEQKDSTISNYEESTKRINKFKTLNSPDITSGELVELCKTPPDIGLWASFDEYRVAFSNVSLTNTQLKEIIDLHKQPLNALILELQVVDYDVLTYMLENSTCVETSQAMEVYIYDLLKGIVTPDNFSEEELSELNKFPVIQKLNN